MKTITGNLLEVKKGIIAHQVNCLGIMGAGLALQIAKRWPHVDDQYEKLTKVPKIREQHVLLGYVQFVPVSQELTVANVFGQHETVHKGRGVATDYAALEEAFRDIDLACNGDTSRVFFPFKFGCGLAGGDWRRVLELLEHYCPDATIMQLPEATAKQINSGLDSMERLMRMGEHP